MRRILIPLVAAAALAAPASAFAHHGGHFGDGDRHGAIAGFEKLSGTGTSFASTSASATGSLVASVTHPNGHFSATLSTTWSSAQTKTFGGTGKNDNDGDDDGNNNTAATSSFSCAPATASVTLSNGTSSTATYTGKTCSWTHNGSTVYGFAGSASDGSKAFLKEDGATVTGAVFAGHTMAPMSMKAGAAFGANVSLSLGSKHGNCDHH